MQHWTTFNTGVRLSLKKTYFLLRNIHILLTTVSETLPLGFLPHRYIPLSLSTGVPLSPKRLSVPVADEGPGELIANKF